MDEDTVATLDGDKVMAALASLGITEDDVSQVVIAVDEPVTVIRHIVPDHEKILAALATLGIVGSNITGVVFRPEGVEVMRAVFDANAETTAVEHPIRWAGVNA